MPHETPHPPDPAPAHAAGNAHGEAAAAGGMTLDLGRATLPQLDTILGVKPKPLPRPTEIIALENLKGYFKDIFDKLDADPVGAHDFAWEQVGEVLALGCHDVQTVILARRRKATEARMRPLAEAAEAQGISMHDLAARCLGYGRPA